MLRKSWDSQSLTTTHRTKSDLHDRKQVDNNDTVSKADGQEVEIDQFCLLFTNWKHKKDFANSELSPEY